MFLIHFFHHSTSTLSSFRCHNWWFFNIKILKRGTFKQSWCPRSQFNIPIQMTSNQQLISLRILLAISTFNKILRYYRRRWNLPLTIRCNRPILIYFSNWSIKLDPRTLKWRLHNCRFLYYRIIHNVKI